MPVPSTPATPEPTERAERSHTLVPMVEVMASEWPSHTRRCLQRLPARLRWATPLLDPDHPRAVECTHAQARELLLWLHHRPSHEHPIVGCHRHRSAQPHQKASTMDSHDNARDTSVQRDRTYRVTQRVKRPGAQSQDGLYYAACSQRYSEEVCGCPICQAASQDAQ